MSGPNDKIEKLYEQYHHKIRRFLSLKTDTQTAEDIAQLTFVKAMENLHTFRGDSSEFTWLSSIAGNSLKNELRKQHRIKEDAVDLLDTDRRFIAVEFTKNVELRIDISMALVKLNPLDREIISLHYDVGCTLREVSELVGMKTSAVKNRLYRALTKLRNDFQTEEVQRIMEALHIAVVSKDSESMSIPTDDKIYRDVLAKLKANVDRICSKLHHKPSSKMTIEIYPDLHTFHLAVHEPDAPDWFMGMIEGNTIRITSPLNPGPEHTYESILKSTVHLFTMWLVKDINPYAPKWLYQGLGGYEAGLMTEAYINDSVRELVEQGELPALTELEDNSWDFETRKGFQFSYLLCEFVLNKYGIETLNKIIRKPNDFEDAFACSSHEFHNSWKEQLRARLNL
ncbi:RNA polymerase sigma factor [Paenibacillus glycanilyticus]|uniref:RNA polymerase sigma factor n=1 Tax=Paenibacillus glycanilyticus TaxID=126569 RepID=UPI0020402D0F|nr:RNA polymerase sigma factor [Paenibacillus glycanilyticus]MCM3628379.1 RNA polymerase sigma factor [Paenibacillus glycanilyticus]